MQKATLKFFGVIVTYRYTNKLESTPFTSYNGDQYKAAYNARGSYNMGHKSPLQ